MGWTPPAAEDDVFFATPMRKISSLHLTLALRWRLLLSARSSSSTTLMLFALQRYWPIATLASTMRAVRHANSGLKVLSLAVISTV